MKTTGIRNLRLTIVICAVFVIGGCDNPPKIQRMADDALVDSATAKYLMPEELSEKALQEIKDAIATSDTLTEVFPFQWENGWKENTSSGIRYVIERMMQSSSNYEGLYVYAHEWVSQDSVTQYFLDYLRQKDSSVKKVDSVRSREVLDDIRKFIGNSSQSTMIEINSWSHVEMNGEANYTIGMYKELLKKTSDRDIQRTYFQDYAEWIDLFAAVNERHRGQYSMYPLEINTFGSTMMRLRARMLREEIELMHKGKDCQWDLDNHPINWKSGDADLLRPWYNMRMESSKTFRNKRFAEAFRRMTDKIAYQYLTTSQFDIVNDYEN